MSLMTEGSRRSEDDAVLKTLGAAYCPPRIREARERQDALLLEKFRGRSLAILDVGCGDGYHGSLFAPSAIAYHGIEIAPDIARLARDRWTREGLSRAELFLGDVAEIDLTPGFYDVAWCLYFTPGNLRDIFEDLSLYDDAYLDNNPKFVSTISRLLASLKPGGRIFLTVYRDVPEAEADQIDFYEHTGQHVITPRGSRFVATAERFWSARWTKGSMLSNLAAAGVSSESVRFHDLNEIAWLVEVDKRDAPAGGNAA
jgi:SAM-dependent methyltransferase